MVNKFKVGVQKTAISISAWLGTNWSIAAIFSIVIFALLSGVLVFHSTTFFTNLDNVDQFYTWYQKLATSLHHGYLPIWNANVFGGQSFAGELQPGVFYPFNILWVLLFGSVHGISQLALDYLMAIHFLIGAFGCYLLLKQLGAKKWAAFLSGLVFAFSGMVAFRSISQTVIFFGLALLPYPLYFFAKFHDDTEKRVRWLIASGAFLGLIILSGHVAPFFYAFLALGIFEPALLWKNFTSVRSLGQSLLKSIKAFVVILVTVGVIAAPQIVISAPYLPNAYRIQASGYTGPGEKIDYGDFAKSFSVDIHEFANLIDPVSYPIRDGNNVFIGLVPLTIIVLAVFLAGRHLKRTTLWTKHASFVTFLLIFGIVAMVGYATWFAVVLYELPFVYQIREMGRYSILFHLALMAILAISLEVMGGLKLSKRQKQNLTLIGIFLLINAVYLLLLRQHIFSLHHALQVGLSALILLAVALLEVTRARRLIIGILVVTTLAVNTLWFLPNIKTDTKLTTSYSLLARLIAVLEQSNGRYRVEIQDDALPVNIGNVYKVQTIGGYAATIYAPYYEFLHKSGLDEAFIRDLLGVQLVVTKQKPAANEYIAYSNSELYVVRRASALPKFFMSDVPGSTDRATYHPLSVLTQVYTDRTQKYVVTVDTATTAIISEIAYTGWHAKIDGRPAILKTYVVAGSPLLKSLDIPAGTHVIELSYKPFEFF